MHTEQNQFVQTASHSKIKETDERQGINYSEGLPPAL